MFDPLVSEQNIDPVPRSTRSKDHQDDHHTHDHVHDPGVSSVSIFCEGNLDLEKLTYGLVHCCWNEVRNLLLMEERFVFQGNTSFKEKPEIMLSSATEAIRLNMMCAT